MLNLHAPDVGSAWCNIAASRRKSLILMWLWAWESQNAFNGTVVYIMELSTLRWTESGFIWVPTESEPKLRYQSYNTKQPLSHFFRVAAQKSLKSYNALQVTMMNSKSCCTQSSKLSKAFSWLDMPPIWVSQACGNARSICKWLAIELWPGTKLDGWSSGPFHQNSALPPPSPISHSLI